MRIGSASVLAASIFVLAACTVTSTPGTAAPPPSGSSAPPGASSESPTNPSPSGSQTVASAAPADVDIDGTCAALTACGGLPSGTWDYQAGCVEDVFAEVREQCPALDTSGMDVSVKGSLFFVGASVSRDATLSVSGSLVFPSSCALGECSTLGSLLKTKGYSTASCSGTTTCTCSVEKTDVTKTTATFTTSGDQITLGSGETYSFCIAGDTLRYEGRSAGSEVGVWTLARR